MKERLKKYRSLIIEAVLAITAALGAFFLVYSMGNAVGSLLPPMDPFQDFDRVLPLVLMCVLSIYALFAYHAYRHSTSGRNAALAMIVNGLVGVGLATVALIYVFVYMIMGRYPSFSGYPTVGFPIDIIIYLLVEEFSFLAFYLYGLWLRKRTGEFPVLVERHPKLYGLKAVFYSAGALIALSLFAGFLVGLGFEPNSKHFFVQLMFVLCLLLPIAGYAMNEVFLSLGTGKKGRLIGVSVYTGVCVLFIILFYVARFTDPRGYVEVSAPYLVVDYMLSMGITPACLLITCVALISTSWLSLSRRRA